MRLAPLASLAASGLLVLTVTTACGSDAAVDETEGSAAAGYPVSVDNCGTGVTLAKPPQRIVTIKSTSTDLVLALGLADKIVGTAFADGPVAEEWAEDAADLPVLAEQAPSQEVVLETEPDLVLAGWESNFAADTAGERDMLAKLGVATYVAPSACQEPGYQPAKMTFDLLFEHFTEAGRVLGVPEAAEKLVAQQRAALDKVGKALPGTTALWWSSGEDTPFVGGTIGAPQMVLDALGLENVVREKATWTSYGWEAIVDADPDVIVLVDAAWNSAKDKIASLEANPATAELTAVRKSRYLVVPFPAAEAGVRSVSAALELADQLERYDLLVR
ncbi:putative F420-0 ABC transporter substrate-binding protein [Nocardioides sp. zg-536]|uniref:F420-0 ABC transporter substrate-binding protein n=1 Tax=Nocardioides faecalis TaxID=2803858 RepID=A0A938Y6G1_9ACTN|nr:putative F420-0 ABC transporter substrate-binding protein [Nocardioides faecalis]MBM9459098.1 putative F420-0 ABC transporter substrate-binding protein [Nocardioides faecalis]QVI57356.1 putative F420-0 ABC transporter substrate-binding protein [Nocardioides faecalis]